MGAQLPGNASTACCGKPKPIVGPVVCFVDDVPDRDPVLEPLHGVTNVVAMCALCLLVALPPDKAKRYLAALRKRGIADASVIGEATAPSGTRLVIGSR